jgi:ActR/RegA family two-component response regulator
MNAAADVAPMLGGLRVLAAADDAAVLRTIERTCTAEHHAFHFATGVAEALATGTTEQPDLAFVDVTLDNGAGLALVHHLPAVCTHAVVYAIVPPPHLELGTQAMALGAAGILLAPPSGDGLLLALSEVRGRREAALERTRLLRELEAWKLRSGRLERIARLAGQGDRAEAALAIAEGLAEASRASGAAIYVVQGDRPEDRTRLAAVGSAAMLDAKGGLGQSLEGAQLRNLAVGGRTVGYAFLDNPSKLEDASVQALLDVASAVLAAASPVPTRASESIRPARVFPRARFKDAATRELELARRHGRRLAIGALLAPDPEGQELEELVLAVVRESDVLGRGDGGEYFLLLPETGALGAHACRRRVLRLASSVETTRGPASRRSLDRASGPRLMLGVATYPHDGAVLESLMDRARRRAEGAARSIVHERDLPARPLRDVFELLLDDPLPEDAPASPSFSRATLPKADAQALVAAACREALRGGSTTLIVATRPESGTLSVSRASALDPLVTLHEVDASRLDVPGPVEALVLVAEHGTWTYCARIFEHTVLAACSADPILADLLAERLAKASGVRFA